MLVADPLEFLKRFFTPRTVFDASDWRARGDVFGQALFTPEHFGRNVAVAERLTSVARDLGTTLPGLAVAWVLRHPQVDIPTIR